MENEEVRDYLKRVTLELHRVRTRLQQVEESAAEPIAIVAMSCRYPDAHSPEELWQLLEAGADAISQFPTDRGWDMDAVYDPDPEAPGKSYARHGGFLRDAARFDAAFFGMNAREALASDPQQRLLLELAWEAVERAGLAPDALHGSSTGVFVGASHVGYGSGAATLPTELEGYGITGTALSVVSGRIAYSLGLHGPTVTVDTACSSSLVALHLACQALRQRECNLALAGGAAVIASPLGFIAFSRQRGLAPDGRCKSFSAQADGTGWAEGAGMLVLERLSDAQRNAHPVLAIVRGSAVNQDGKSQGLTAPNGPAQVQVIQRALRSAQLSPADVDAVEAHGTGTTLGDPIEAQALIEAYGAAHSVQQPLWLGSLKSNIGHAQAAAGVGGVIKLVLALQHELLPKTLHAEDATPHVDWSAGTVKLLHEARPWKENGRPRRAAVSAFGVSGTNAHVILEQAPASSQPAKEPALARVAAGALPFLLSAQSHGALSAQAQKLRSHLLAHAELELLDVAHSLATTRTVFEVRAALIADDRASLLAQLAQLAAGGAPPATFVGSLRGASELALLFTGQGSQRPRMGRELSLRYPVFGAALDAVFAHFDGAFERPLREVMFAEPHSGDAALLDQTGYAQPALFALEVALYRLLESLGIRAKYLLGHSVGEIAAAHVAGVMSLRDACTLVAARARLMQALPAGGAMLALEASESELADLLAQYGDRVSLAAVNGARSLVLSGDESALHELRQVFELQGRKVRRLSVSHAFHSARMEPMLDEFERVLRTLSLGPARLAIVSNVTGELAPPELFSEPSYWLTQVREAVRFYPGVLALRAAGASGYLELGPDGVLSGLVREALEQETLGDAAPASVPVWPVLRKERDESHALLQALAALHECGQSVDFQAFFLQLGGRAVALPTYAFQREHYWLASQGQAGDAGSLGLSVAEHPLLGASLALADGDQVAFTGRLSLASHGWLSEHLLFGVASVPSAAVLELALAVGQRLVGREALVDLTLHRPLLIPERGAVQIQLLVGRPDEHGARSLALHARREDSASEGEWTRYALGKLADSSAAPLEPLPVWPPTGALPLAVQGLYEGLSEAGAQYGESFRCAHAAYRRGDELFVELVLPESARADAARYVVHPGLLEAAQHVLALRAETAELRLPCDWQGVRLFAPGATELRVRLSPGAAADEVSLQLWDGSGAALGEVASLRTRALSEAELRGTTAVEEALYRVEWQTVPTPEACAEPWSLLGENALVWFGAGAQSRAAFGLGAEPGALPATYTDLAALQAWLGTGAPAPRRVVLACAAEPGLESLHAVHAASHRMLALLQAWLSDERLASTELVVLTRGAVAAGEDDDVDDLTHAPLWGLLRSAQTEYPDRGLRLIDLEGEPSSCGGLLRSALSSQEPQLALRAGGLRAARLAKAHVSAPFAALALPGQGTVLITGGTGALGAHVARHLVAQHGVRHLLLCSRSGGASALVAELEAQGACVRVAACDVSDRSALQALLGTIPKEHGLTAVIHTAGVIDDGVLLAQSASRIDHVFGPKLDGAWHLHALTRDLPLSAFVLFSSLSGVLGAAGQSNYAAANAFLDALAQQRRARGLVATSLAWGYWSTGGALTGQLDDADRARIARAGIEALSAEQGMALLDAALARSDAQLVPAHINLASLRALPGLVPSMLQGLVKKPVARAAAHSSLARRLAGLSEPERQRALLEVIAHAVSAVLGAEASSIGAERPLAELGLDSLMALELRARLGVSAGLRLPSTLLYDYPTPNALCQYLSAQLVGAKPELARPLSRVGSELAEPIAIVAMSCRFPGQVQSPEALWRLLVQGGDVIGDFPSERGWDVASLYDPDPDAKGKSSVCKGGFLHELADFDPGFFGISPREALATDPQQRLLLETAWEAFERLGVKADALHGSATGVFVGMNAQEYGLREGLASEELEGYLGIGSAASVASGRIAYSFGLQGPAITLDTACSSSLVALHLACHSLRVGECDLALAGGVTAMVTPRLFVEFSRQRGLAPDGHCKPFSAHADGTGWSEGVGMLVLERLSDAERQGHRVLALVRGSAINQDGKSQGLTAPNGPAQQQVIRQALASAQLSAREVDVVEAHGTGTTLGDPIEAQALLATYGQERSADQPLWLGSVKSNLGHTQAAAGVAGVIKLVLALEHELLPKSLYAEEPTPHVDWSAGSVQLLRESVPWKTNGQPRRAGVSSFGVSGTNAHVILEEAPARSAAREPAGERAPAGWLPFAISAKSPVALRAQVERLRSHLVAQPELSLVDVAHSLATTRTSFAWRALVVAAERDELLETLRAVSQGETAASAVVQQARAGGKLAFVFPGQGSQWLGMAQALMASSEVFTSQLKACERALSPHVTWSLLEVLDARDESALERVEVVQPVLFAVMVSLAALWRSQGIEPDAVIGHSQGEIAAAYVAGALSLDDAARVVALRARALTRLSGRGGMAAVELGAEPLRARLERFAGRLSIAAINSPSASVVSGDAQAIDALLEELARAEILARRIRVDYASHCAQLDEIKDELLGALATIEPKPTRIALYSTVRAELLEGTALDAAYWYENGRATVRFCEAVQGLLASGHRHFVEVSPHPVLTQAVQNTAETAQESVNVVGTLRRNQGGFDRFLLSLGQLHVRGLSVDWSRPIQGGRKLLLPTYAFQRERYWLERDLAAGAGDAASLGLSSADHPLLGASVVLAEGEGALVFMARLSLSSQPWLAGHALHGSTILPATAILELALAVAHRVGLSAVEELTLEAPLLLPENAAVHIQLSVGAPGEGNARSLTLHSRREEAGAEHAWTRHASGTLGAATTESESHDESEALRTWPPEGSTSLPLAGLYEGLAQAGVVYGEAFRGLCAAYRRADELFAEVQLPASASKEAARYGLHPALLDAALQVLALRGQEAQATMPFAWQGASLSAAGASALRVRLRVQAADNVSLLFADASGELVGRIDALRTQPASVAQVRRAATSDGALYHVEWRPIAPAAGSARAAQAHGWVCLGSAASTLLELPEPSARYADLAALGAALDAGEPAPRVVVVPCWQEATDALVQSAHAAAHRMLALLQAWLADERLAASRLLVVTRDAIAASARDPVLGLSQAALWGLVRSAQSEHPDADIRLLDLDHAGVPEAGAAAFAEALVTEERQLALRAGALLMPRLARRPGVQREASAARAPDFGQGTVLITGGAGELASLVAQHLVEQHGVRRLVLCSRTGRAPALQARLEAQGASVRVAACDVSQREQVAELLASIPTEQPLTAVIHTAGVFDDGVLAAQSAERIDRQFAPKLAGAWHLHELTSGLDLSAFVMFSSVAGVLGGPGQSNYAAANAFLDALAQHRSARGLPATALAWGLWARSSGLGEQPAQTALPRNRMSLVAMSAQEGLALLDAALSAGGSHWVPARFDARAWTAPEEQQLPMLQGLMGHGPRRLRRAAAGSSSSSLQARLATLSALERERVLLGLIAAGVSTVMAVPAASVEAERPLSELGLDSLMAVELRNHLAVQSGLRLPSTLLFDQPTPSALCRYLEARLSGVKSSLTPAVARTSVDRAEPIAIVALGCRYPGGAHSPEALWQLLAAGAETVGEFPSDRGWDAEALYDPNADTPGKSTSCYGSFLREATSFDAAFFSISPREALAIDPQQRLLLETAWEALERAGIDPSSLQGSATGVFVGLAQNQYNTLDLPAELEAYLANGSAGSVASGRIAYSLGLQGPAVTVDTACSSSLVALHWACQSLRQGECDLALAGGATVMATPSIFVEFSRQRGLAPDGRCKSFSDTADGTAFGEGVGMLVLERLSDAQRNGHPVLAVLRGSAINQDGKSQGLTAPNGPAQEQVIRQALANAQLAASDVDAVEAHGTGTTLGDPIEAQAILATYGAERSAEQPLWLGSLKSNLGHTMCAAGVGGVIKLVLALQHQLLPRSLHAAVPTRHVDWSLGPVRLLNEAVAWKPNGRPRRAGVSSFGISGTNAHMIVEEAPLAPLAPLVPSGAVMVDVAREAGAASTHGAHSVPELGALPFLISGKNEAALAAQAERLRAHLVDHPELSPLDVAYSLVTTRASLQARAVLVADSRDVLVQQLEQLSSGRPGASSALGRAREGGRLSLLFTGQGSQRPQMGKQLYERYAEFRAAFDAALEAFDGALERPLRDVMFAPAESDDAKLLDLTGYAQPALFVLEVALYRLLEAWGVRADYLLGHSVGEIVAAHVAGVLSLGDACQLVLARARLMQALPPGGAMAALEASEDELCAALEQSQDRVSLAALNGPRSLVISGDETEVLALVQQFAAQGRKVRRLAVSHAFHSRRMEPMLEQFEQQLSRLTFRPAQLAIVSTLTGELASAELLSTPSYWLRQVREAVRFHPGLTTLQAAGVSAYLELGPDGVLSALASEALGADQPGQSAWPVLRKGRDEAETWLLALGGLHTTGQRVGWRPFLEACGGRRVALPTYAFQREHYWPSGQAHARAGDVSSAGLSSAEHPLLGASVALAESAGMVLTGRLSLAGHNKWLAGHVIHGTTILPGTGFVELALAAAYRVGLSTIDELTLESSLVLPERGGVQIQLAVAAPDEAGTRSLTVHSRLEDSGPEGVWTRHASGTLSSGPSPWQDSQPAVEALRSWPPEGAIELSLDGFYEQLAARGMAFGEAFRGLRAAYRRGDELFAEASLAASAGQDAARYGLHPALFDAALHALLLHVDAGAQVTLPFAWQGVSLRLAGVTALRVKLSLRDPERVSLLLADGAGELVGQVQALRARPASAAQVRGAAQLDQALYSVDWPTVPQREGVALSWALVAGEGERAALPGASACYPDVAALSAALDAGDAVPETVVLPYLVEADASAREQNKDHAADLLARTHEATHRALAALQAWFADERLAARRLVVLTRGAVAAGADDPVPNLTHAPLWGLVRAAQAEHADKVLRLLDTDPAEPELSATAAATLAAALAADEPQLALRAGTLRAPRLVRRAPPSGPLSDARARRLAQGTVLITGGSGALAGLVAEHLVARHGVRHLLLCSRSGRTEALVERLLGHGATVTSQVCDVAERAELEAVLATIPAERPLVAVIHTAAVIDDGVLAAQSRERVDAVFAAKLGGAWHLHELTRERELEAFVLFSSVAGVLGGPGQSNYAAANTFLDALAQHRRAQGLVGTSLAWGYWAARSGLTAQLARADLERMARGGIKALSSDEALALFDASLSLSDAQLVPTRFDPRLFSATATAALPSMLAGLGASRLPRAASSSSAGSLKTRLVSLASAERARVLLDLVLAAVSTVMAVPAASIATDRPLSELGIDSLMAVELRNQLALLAGLRLPSTLLFDQPTPGALCRFLEAQLLGAQVAPTTPPVQALGASSEPIAIVATSCRFPGGTQSPEALWQLLVQAGDVVGDFPSERGWDGQALYDPDADATGKSTVCKGGFLRDAADFDPAFFGMAPREALATDPQQRLLLETSWEALERAGIVPASLQGSATGVFVGIMYNDYATRFVLGGAGALEGQLGVGSAPSVASGRIAYSLGLQGPAITVDTACSSSLVTLHLACQALRQGECDLALAGGATVMATPGTFVEFSRQRGMAADGRCKSFSTAADGVGWSEGVGMLLLERLSDARRNGHPVLALVRGSAVNQDGKSQGLTAPNGPAQEQVIRQALASAQLSPSDVDAVEGHGTGTTLGDPIEAQALIATYGAHRLPDRPLWLGSVKSNLGHTQAAAGAAGVIKLVLALQHQLLPRSLHAEAPSEHVDWSAGTIKLLHEAAEWKAEGRPRRAGVSSFGISGTNAHVILEEAPEAPAPRSEPERAAGASAPHPVGPLPFLLSARSEAALGAQAERLAAHLVAQPDLTLLDLAHSLATTRTSFEVRSVVVAQDRPALLAALEQLAAGTASSAAALDRVRSGRGLALLFTGQGSQRPQMGLELYRSFPVFRAALEATFQAFDGLLERPLRELMFADVGSDDAALLDHTAYTQPALFALEVALYRLLEAWGVRPQYLLGHSVGEIAAAHVADVMSLADACRLVAARARLMQALPAGGAMVSLAASEQELRPWLSERADRVSLAAVNGPSSVVVSGDEDAVLELSHAFAERGHKVRRLSVSHAFHSARMEPMLEAFERVVSGLTLRPARIPIVSNVSGELALPESFSEPSYWLKQVREPVRFYPGLLALHAAGASGYLELGPQAVLSTLAEEALTSGQEDGPRFWSSLRKGRDEQQELLRALGGLHASGHSVEWGAFFAPLQGCPVALPTYAFQRQRYWLAAAAGTADAAAMGLASISHPLLSTSVVLAQGDGALLTGRLSLASQPWLSEHLLFGSAVLPASAILELGLTVARRFGLEAIESLTLTAPLTIPERGGVHVQLAVGAPDARACRSLSLYSRREELGADAPFTLHAQGTLGAGAAELGEELRVWPPAGSLALDTAGTYDALSGLGLTLGDSFRGLSAVYRRGHDLFAALQLPEAARPDAARYALHPALLETVQYALLRAQNAEFAFASAWHGVRLWATGATELRVKMSPGAAPGSVSLSLADGAGEPLGTIATLVTRALSAAEVRGSESALDGMYRVDWVDVPAALAPAEAWSLLGADAFAWADVASRYASLAALQALLDAGEPVPKLVVFPCLGASPSDSPHRLHSATTRTLELLKTWLADERLAASQLVVLTRRAVATGDDEDVLDLAHAPLWGLLRSAQSEYPDRGLRLIDVDAEPASLRALPAALACQESQLALRAGEARAPRLAKAESSPAARSTQAAQPGAPARVAFAPNGTVLITGGTGALGALVARHLVLQHGARRLLLCSRTGRADALVAELEAQGASVTVAACDVSDRAALGKLLATIPESQALTAVVHTAGLTDDGVLTSQTGERLAHVFASKVEGAWHLHELTRGRPLSAFVMFSSLAAVLGGAGQSNYAAANAFLDALAHHRRALGLAATSLGWGYWAEQSALTGHLSDKDRARMARAGIEPLSAQQGLSLLDAALNSQQPHLVPVRLELEALRVAEFVPDILRGLVRGQLRRVNAASSLKARLASLTHPEQAAQLLRMVRAAIASVTSSELSGIKPSRSVQELGLDSLMALELRKQLGGQTGLHLPATLLFDYPTPSKLVGYLHGELLLELPSAATPVLAELDRLETLLGTVDAGDAGHAALAARLKAFARKWGGAAGPSSTDQAVAHNLYRADDEELYQLIDNSLSE